MEIGDYKIERIDDDHVLVTRNHGDDSTTTAKITGGDMETFLSGIFLGAEVQYKCNGMTTTSTFKTTYEEV